MMNSMWDGIIEFIIGKRRRMEFHHGEGAREAARMQRLGKGRRWLEDCEDSVQEILAGGLRALRFGNISPGQSNCLYMQ
jgi:hypothetical protein